MSLALDKQVSGTPNVASAAARSRSWPLVALFVLTVAIILGARIFGASDLYDKDQSKTIGYTADVVLNGRWLLPRDTLNQGATKPPLYNWIGAIAVMGTRRWDEWVFKLPSILAGIATLAMIVAMGRRAAREMPFVQMQESVTAGQARALEAGLLAGMIWLTSYPAMRQIYLARPDMLLCAFLFGAWLTGTLALDAQRRGARYALAFWICVAGATLSKGPAALLPLLYVIAAAKLVHGEFRALNRLRWWWGLPLMAGLILAWFIPTYRAYPEHVRETMIRGEITRRITEGGPERITVPAYQMFVWFIKDFTPWSLLVLLALVTGRRWFRQPLGPAILWTLLGLLFFSCSGGKRADYLAPLYPQASIIAALWLTSALSQLRMPAWRVALAPAIIALAMGVSHIKHSRDAMVPHSNNIKQFAKQCEKIVGDDRMVFLVSGYHPFLPLMGRHAGNDPSLKNLLRAKWVVCLKKPYWTPVIESGPVRDAYRNNPAPLALYKMNGSWTQQEQLKSIYYHVKQLNYVGNPTTMPGSTPPRTWVMPTPTPPAESEIP